MPEENHGNLITFKIKKFITLTEVLSNNYLLYTSESRR